MIRSVKAYIEQHKIVSLKDISSSFNIDTMAVESMLTILIRKGLIKEADDSKACTSCSSGCPFSCSKFYKWIDKSVKNH